MQTELRLTVISTVQFTSVTVCTTDAPLNRRVCTCNKPTVCIATFHIYFACFYFSKISAFFTAKIKVNSNTDCTIPVTIIQGILSLLSEVALLSVQFTVPLTVCRTVKVMNTGTSWMITQTWMSATCLKLIVCAWAPVSQYNGTLQTQVGYMVFVCGCKIRKTFV